jgi:hypothetical protein
VLVPEEKHPRFDQPGARSDPALIRPADLASAMMTAVTEVRAWPVDPRDTRWEVWNPRFRVYFWRSLGQIWASREFELSAEDVVAVVAWAAEHAEGGETYTIHCVVEGADGTGLVRLAGTDPTRT